MDLLWNPLGHSESFNGPWFEIEGLDGMVAKEVRKHINSILDSARPDTATRD